MDELRASVDTTEVVEAFGRLSANNKDMRTAFRSASRKSLAIIRKSVRQGARTVTSNAEKVKKGVTVTVYRKALGGSVGINRSFKLENGRWFGLYLLELGTKSGIGRNKRLHGATPEKPFFNAAASLATSHATEVLNDNIIQAIDKIQAKRQ